MLLKSESIKGNNTYRASTIIVNPNITKLFIATTELTIIQYSH